MTAASLTTRTLPRPHGVPPRGLLSTPSSSQDAGRFGRMFRRLPVYEVAEQSLLVLAAAMIQRIEEDEQEHLPVLDKPLGADDDDENTAKLCNGEYRLPAGYTYFGQFVDHDITFDPVSSLTRQNDPNALVNFRTPRFDLDSLYGRGPDDAPYAYNDDGLTLRQGFERGPADQRDLPRALVGNASRDAPAEQQIDRAIIGDPRNDENRIVSQLHATFIRFHNRVVEWVEKFEPGLAARSVNHFKRAQQLVRWHYQWVVVHDFLRRIVGDDPFDPVVGVVADILRRQPYLTGGGARGVTRPHLLFYHWREQPFMPIEFSGAAYRFGHSMVRPSYRINQDVHTEFQEVPGKEMEGVFAHRIPIFTDSDGPEDNLTGFRPLPDGWGVDWRFFLHLDADLKDKPQHLPQPSYKIDAELANPLGRMPNSVARPEQLVGGFPPKVATSLAARNLLRGLRLAIPAGEDVAHAMGITPDPEIRINRDFLARAADFDEQVITDAAADLRERTPLWYYVLKEADVLGGGAHLGPVGGRIVAEVLIGLLHGDPLSFLSVQPDWTPIFPRRDGSTNGPYTLADLVAFAIGELPVPDELQAP